MTKYYFGYYYGMGRKGIHCQRWSDEFAPQPDVIKKMEITADEFAETLQTLEVRYPFNSPRLT